MRKKRRIRLCFGLVCCLIILGYCKYRSKKLNDATVLNRTPAPRSDANILKKFTESGILRTVKTKSAYKTAVSEIQTEDNTVVQEYTVQKNMNTSNLLLKYLSNLEKLQLLLPTEMKKSVFVTGIQSVIDRDIQLYKKAFALHNFTVLYDKSSLEVLQNKNWTVLLCLSYSDAKDCFQGFQFSELKRFQKISHIPGIRSILGKKDSLCQITSASTAQIINGLRSDIQLAPTCWVMPGQYQQFASATTSLKAGHKLFFVKPVSAGLGWRSQVINLEKHEDVEYIRRFHLHSGVVQEYFGNQLSILDKPFSIRVFVLVTSLSPLRAYLYGEGIVYFRTSYRKSHHRLSTKHPWHFAQLREHLQTIRGPQAVEAVFRNIQLAVVQLLLRAEPHVATYYGAIGGDPFTGSLFRCHNCYQLLGIDLVVNTSLHVMISEVNGQPNMQEAFQEDVAVLNSIKEQMLCDLVGLVFSTDSVASAVLQIIDKLHAKLASAGCGVKQKYCLIDSDLNYLLSWQREIINLGNFKQLYPSADLMLHKSSFAASHVHDTNLRDALLDNEELVDTLTEKSKSLHSTMELHDLIFDVIKLSGSAENTELASINISSLHKIKVPLLAHKMNPPVVQQQNEEYFGALLGNVLGGNKVSASPCSNSLNQMPYLSQLVVSPGRLQPSFDTQVTKYKLVIPHESPMIYMAAIPAHCSCVAKFSTDHGTNLRIETYNHVNWTFGVGDTDVHWLLLDSSHNQPWVINQYSISVTRQSLFPYEITFTTDMSHKVCALTQDCDLKVYPDRPCGLYELNDDTWQSFKSHHFKKPKCNDGNVTGHWMLPCVQCARPSTCFWHEAMWTPKNCQHTKMTQGQSKSCTSNKKILLIGDSTCRGIMYYLIEKVNGSLQDWTESYSSVTHKNVNNGLTTFTFSYYPQFWLAKKQRPVYERTLVELLEVSKPLSNDSNTVLIVGGVQWMNNHHIRVTQQVLNHTGLTGIIVILKGLSSGFYQPTTGINWVSLEGQKKLIKLQNYLSQSASMHGFKMIDTLGMTITRHKHFLYGNCACQFHKVLHFNSSVMNESANQNKVLNGYHVSGDINAVYSEIALNILCHDVT